MRELKTEILRGHLKGPLNTAETINISQLGIEKLGAIDECSKLVAVCVADNHIVECEILSKCRQLWRIDLTSNRVSILDGLDTFKALGCLVLTNNEITWNELKKLRVMHIIELVLTGIQTFKVAAQKRSTECK